MYLTRITLSILSNMNFGVTVKSVDWYVNSTTAQGPHDYARCVCQKWVDWLRRNPGLLLVSWTILLNTSNDNVIQTKYRPKFSLPSENICNKIEIHWRTEVIFVNAALYTGVFLISPINSRFVSESRTWRMCPARASRDMFPMQWYFCILTEVPCTKRLYLRSHKPRRTAIRLAPAKSSSDINYAEFDWDDRQYTRNNGRVLKFVSDKTRIRPPVKWFAPYWERYKTKCDWTDLTLFF